MSKTAMVGLLLEHLQFRLLEDHNIFHLRTVCIKLSDHSDVEHTMGNN